MDWQYEDQNETLKQTLKSAPKTHIPYQTPTPRSLSPQMQIIYILIYGMLDNRNKHVNMCMQGNVKINT